jgi:hypothetical protein
MGAAFMTPASTFAAFADLAEITQATDTELSDMLVYGCKQAPITNFEDVMTEYLLRMFRAVTGVPWVRGWEQGARPAGQFATIWVYSATAIGAPVTEYAQVIDGATNVVQPDLCEVVYQEYRYQFQLDSYRDSGVPNRNQDLTLTTAPRLSAIDVLTRLRTALSHPRMRAALAEQCIYLGGPAFGIIRNLAKLMVQNTYESRASVDFFIHARTMSSLRAPAYGTVDVGYMCPPDNLLFPDPPVAVNC